MLQVFIYLWIHIFVPFVASFPTISCWYLSQCADGICLITNLYLHPFGCSISLNLLPVFVSLNSGQILVFGERSMRALVSWQTTQTDQSSENDQIHFDLLDHFKISSISRPNIFVNKFLIYMLECFGLTTTKNMSILRDHFVVV